MVFYFDLVIKLHICQFYYFRAVENPAEKGGSFDSSGAFHDNHYEEEHRYNMGNEQSREV
jgi:hypothetical protein